MIFLATLESLLVKRPQAELLKRDLERRNKTRAQVNRAVSYVTLVDRVTELLADPRSSPEETLNEIELRTKKSRVVTT